MKKLILLLLLMFPLAKIYADFPKGVGIFKIGSFTLDDFKKYINENKLTVVETKTNVFESISADIIKILPDPNDIESLSRFVSFCESGEVYCLKEYTVSGIEIENIYLYFYKNELYQVVCDDSSELGDAMVLKYGEGEKKFKESKPVTCKSTSKKDQTVTQTWINDDNFASSRIISKYYDYKCEEDYMGFFCFIDLKLLKEHNKCSDRVKKKYEEKKEKEKKKKLNLLDDL